MGISGAKMAKIYNDATDEYVDIRLISKQSSYEKKGIGEEDLDGNLIHVEDEASLLIAFYDGDKAAQLETWQKNHTKLKVVVIGIEDYIFWNRPSTILLTEPSNFKPGGRNIRSFKMAGKGADMDISRQPGFEIGIANFVASYNSNGDPQVMNLLPATFTNSTETYSADGQDFTFNTVILDDGY